VFLEFLFVHGKNSLPRAGFDAAVLQSGSRIFRKQQKRSPPGQGRP
jgi:hypothetical protein